MQKIYNDLVRLLGDNKVVNDPSIVYLHNRDAIYMRGNSRIVVFPESLDDVRKVVRYCYENEIRIYPQGGSSELTGSSIGWEDGIIISFIRMNRILEFSPIDRYIVVEPGLKLIDLNNYLEEHGYIFPIDPASVKNATVGGAINTGAGGLKGFKYGTMKDWVLGLEIVLPDKNATVLNLGSKTLKNREGYDLTRLIVGSEGTLALVTKAVLKVARKPSDIVSIAAFFDDLDSLMSAVVDLLSKDYKIMILEFVDRNTVELVKSHGLTSIESSGHMLILGVEKICDKVFLDDILGIIESHGGRDIIFAESIEDAENIGIYSIRRGFYTTFIELAAENSEGTPFVYTEDISVPPSRLPELIRDIEKIVEKYKVPIGIAGHAGDGNIHPTMYAVDDESKERVLNAAYEIMYLAIKYGGVISSEHGIGLLKKDMLLKAYHIRGSEKALEIMKGIKHIFDPKNILNPDKVLPEVS